MIQLLVSSHNFSMLSLNYPKLMHNFLRYRSTSGVVAQLFGVIAQLSA